MPPLDYKALRATGQRRRRFDPDVAAARKAESHRRTAIIQSRSLHALARAFPDEYRALTAAAREEVYAERGPLPGDELS